MKKRIITIGTVLIKTGLIIFLVVTLNRIFMPKYITENTDGRITREYYPNAAYTDVIFAGPSTVYSDVIPDELWKNEGISSYLRANASQTVCISYYLVEDAIKCHKPELVCFDTTFIKYGDDFVEEPSTRKSLDGMRMSLSKLRCIKAAMGEDENLADYLMPLFRYHNRWKELTWDDIRYAWYMRPITDKGYIMDTEVSAADRDELVYTREGGDMIAPGNMAYLEKMIRLCQDNDIQIMLFKTPSLSDNWSTDLDEQLSEVAARYGISYINFDMLNDDIGLDYSTDSPDGGSHLNYYGAVKFSRYIGDYIKDNYTVSDRRNDSKYTKKWQKADDF